ncbi:MAG: SMP-30/gluconolactonase/LRE family protein [Planctomycetes bacterium]|nr:SMP-30/gluconolactonase/LRE family protein [Planctomycetota bacterium]
MTTKNSLHDASLPVGIVAPQSQVTPAAVIAFTEGPAIDRNGDVYFSDLQNNRILKLSATGDLSVFREDAGRANGNYFDREGRLITCEGAEFGPGGRRRLVRTDLQNGEITLLTERFEGKRYNSPNDVCVDSRGNIYFTDPRYGDQSGREMEVEAVYRLETSGQVRRLLNQPAIQKPNGVAITPDDRMLYLVDSNPLPGGNRKIWAFALDANGNPSGQRLVYDFGAGRGGDGMRLDAQGNLWIAAGINVHRGRPGETMDVPAGIYVVSSQGKLLGRIPIPEDTVTNLTFGPPDKMTLYVTAGRNLYRLPIQVSGYTLYP